MGDTALDIILLAGAIAYFSFALVHKDGPYGILQGFRVFAGKHLGKGSPLGCVFCTSFWVGLVVLSFFVSGDVLSRALIQYFGVLGVATVFFGGYEK